MESLTKQKFRALAKSNGWSLAQAEGFVDGQTVRRRGTMPSKYALVGIDEYCAGFRAGYFDRQGVDSAKRHARDRSDAKDARLVADGLPGWRCAAIRDRFQPEIARPCKMWCAGISSILTAPRQSVVRCGSYW
jgi:hypothetical protein